MRKLSLVEVGTHAELALVVKGLKEKDSAEQAMAPALFRHLKPSMLLLWDRGFFSYELWQQMILRDCQVLHCLSPEARGHTPSDFRDADLSQDALDMLVGMVAEDER